MERFKRKGGIDMKNIKKYIAIILSALLITVVFTGCSDNSSSNSKKIIFGVAPGPYGDLVKLAIKPGLEKKGYTVELKEFSDYIQPNKALANNEIDVNVFQHQVYLENFEKEHNLKIESIKNIPTAGMGIFSNNYKSLDQLSDGDTVSIPNDVPNLARALRFLAAEGVITLKDDVDLTTVSEKDIAENPKNLKFTTVEAAQLPRTLSSVNISVINGNYAISSGLSLGDAVVTEKLNEEYKNVIAIRSSDKDSEFVKDILEVVESDDFKNVILDDKNIFKDFDFPEWFQEKVGE